MTTTTRRRGRQREGGGRRRFVGEKRGAERSGGATQGYSAPRNAPQYKRKKQHWQVSPSTRVRVRQRIRRWDGIMYNIDLFPYVEHRLLAFIG